MILIVLSIALILVLFILIRWNCYNVPFDRDEGEYAYSAWIMREGVAPYKNSFLQKPPLIVYTYYLAQLISSDSLWPPRLLATLFLAGTVILVGLIAYKEAGKRAGIVASALLTAMFSFPYLMVNSANTEEFMLLPLLGLLALYVFFKDKPIWWHWGLAGVLAATSLLYKPIGVFVILFILIYWLWGEYKGKNDYRRLLITIGQILTGFILVILASLGYYFVKGGVRELFESAVVFNLYYANEQGYGFSAMVPHLQLFFKDWWALILLSGYYVFIRPRNFWFYAGLLFFALLGIYQSAVGHYYIALLPFWALFLTFALERVLRGKLIQKYININLFASLLLVFLIFIIIYPIRTQYTKTSKELSLWIYDKDNPFTESKIIADKIDQYSTAGDTIYIAGSEPQILWYAKRMSPTRFVITYPHSMNTEKAVVYQKEVISDLGDSSPKMIVLSQRQSSGFVGRNSSTLLFNYLMAMITDDYELKGGYVWYDGSSGAWQDEFGEDEIGEASLLVFVKK